MTPEQEKYAENYRSHKDVIKIKVNDEFEADYCRICRRTEGELMDVTCEEGVKLLTPKPIVSNGKWKESRKKRLLQISASQIETYNLCKRKWWLSRVRKLEEGSTKSQVFGTVVHAVIERYLLADDQGRVPCNDCNATGWHRSQQQYGPCHWCDGAGKRPVDLYPEHWQVAKNRYGKTCEKCKGTKIRPTTRICPDCDGEGTRDDCYTCKGGGHIEVKEPCSYCFGTGIESEGKVTPAEEVDVKRLIQAAIENGVLERVPGRKIEQGFNRTVIKTVCPNCADQPQMFKEGSKCPICNGNGKGTTVQIVGYIDMETNNEVHDHKTTSNMRYAKQAKKESPNWLGKSSQMLIYAKEVTTKCIERGEPVPPIITLRHNVYCAKENIVRKTIAEVTQEDIQREWSKIERTAAHMVELRDNVEEWTDIADPEDASLACNAYGGCPYRSICSHQESADNYENRLEKLKQKAYTNSVAPTQTPNGEHDMPSFKEIMAQQAAAKAASLGTQAPAPAQAVSINPPAPTPTQTAAPVVTTAPTHTVTPHTITTTATVVTANGLPANAPPWASPDCSACPSNKGIAGVGFNKNGAPCKICDLKSAKAGRKTSAEFVLELDGKGNCIWFEKANPDNAGESPAARVAETIKAEVKEVTAAQVAAAEIVQKALDAQTPTVPVVPPATEILPLPTEATTPPPPVEKRKRRTKAEMEAERAGMTPAQQQAAVEADESGTVETGLILAINCAMTKNDGFEVLDLAEVFAHYSADLATTQGAKTFFELDPFKRRDAFAERGAAIAAELGNVIVFCNATTPDVKALVDALRPHAKMVIQASAM